MHHTMTSRTAALLALLLLGCGGGTVQANPAPMEIRAVVRVPCQGPDCDGEATPAPETGRSPITMLALGWSHSCALVEDGGIYCWGANNRGQLGDIGDGERGVPTRVPGLGTMDAVWAGGEMTCARETGEGTIQCWGETGLGPNREQSFATPLPYSGVHAMALGYGTGCFVNEAHVFCWGEYGRPHGPSWNTPTRVEVPRGVSGLVAGMQRHCGLDTRGRINCWGRTLAYWHPERVADPVWRIPDLAGVRMIALAGGPHGRPWIVDRHGHVQRTDTGDEDRRHGTTHVALHEIAGIEDPATLVAGGGGHACSRLSNGTAACWGSNESGQLGDGTTATRSEARYLELGGVQEIEVGQHHTCARAEGGLYCWGRNDSGQVAAERTTRIHEPTVMPW